MDYPKSVPNVGLVGGKFVDENTATGVVGSLIPSVWGNNVTDELLSILSAAGIAPSEAATDQLLQALRGSTLFTTRPQFDFSRAVATTEFVRVALGNISGGYVANTNTTLTAAHCGGSVELYGAVSLTVTMPLIASVGTRSVIRIINLGSVNMNVVVQGSDTFLGGLGISPTLITMLPGDTVEFHSFNGWVAMGGSIATKYSAQFSAALAASGYQKHPSGLIIQWGTFSLAASTTSTFTLPTAYASSGYSITASFGTPASGTVNASFVSASQYQLQNVYTGPQGGTWIAIGK